MTFLIQLGRQTELCFAEVQQLFSQFQLETVDQSFVLIEQITTDQILSIVKNSGGIIKIFAVERLDSLDKTQLLEKASLLLQARRKPQFGLFVPNQLTFSITAQDIKNHLQKLGKPSRFVQANSNGISAAVLLHQNVKEVLIFQSPLYSFIGETIWVQDIDDWSHRDYGKPKRDRKRGMLPPKLARIMINLISPGLQSQDKKTLYDPFCGTGTVLMEAALIDWQVIGSDISATAVHDTAENIHWFSQNYQPLEPQALFIADATQVNLGHLAGKKVDAIVTEPFLGKQQPKPQDLDNMFKGLEKLYWGTFRNWTKLLKSGAEIVIVCPYVTTGKKAYSLESVIDKTKTLGYNLQSGPFIYKRPQTIVQRQIFRLKFDK